MSYSDFWDASALHAFLVGNCRLLVFSEFAYHVNTCVTSREKVHVLIDELRCDLEISHAIGRIGPTLIKQYEST